MLWWLSCRKTKNRRTPIPAAWETWITDLIPQAFKPRSGGAFFVQQRRFWVRQNNCASTEL
jgi:hypothetical protein